MLSKLIKVDLMVIEKDYEEELPYTRITTVPVVSNLVFDPSKHFDEFFKKK